MGGRGLAGRTPAHEDPRAGAADRRGYVQPAVAARGVAATGRGGGRGAARHVLEGRRPDRPGHRARAARVAGGAWRRGRQLRVALRKSGLRQGRAAVRRGGRGGAGGPPAKRHEAGLRPQRHVLLLLRVPPHDRGRHPAPPGAEPRQRYFPCLLGGGRRRPAQVPLTGWAGHKLLRPERLRQGGRPARVGGEEGAEGEGYRPGARGARPLPRDGPGVPRLLPRGRVPLPAAHRPCQLRCQLL